MSMTDGPYKPQPQCPECGVVIPGKIADAPHANACRFLEKYAYLEGDGTVYQPVTEKQ